MSDRADRLIDWIRLRVTAAGAKGLVVGLSGGIDSAVVARLSQLAMPGHTVGVLLPCHSDPQDAADALLAARHYNLPTLTIELDDVFDALVDRVRRGVETAGLDGATAEARPEVARANVKPRLRMTTLYHVANLLDRLVVGTGNRSELTTGYFTKHGDGGVDILPIGNLLKSEVRALARELGVPARLIEKPPSAGLWQGQTDEAEMGFTYEDLERYLNQGPEAVDASLARRIERLARASDHKRLPPPIAPISVP